MTHANDNATILAFPTGAYDVTLADLPWSYHGAQDKMGAAAKIYPTMADGDLLSLPMSSIMSRRAVLFMWATAPRLDFAIQCVSAWGLHYRGVFHVWVKTKGDGLTPIGAQGVRPSIVKPTTEFVLAASNVRKGRPLPLCDESIRNVVLAPKAEHSRKPDRVHEDIERMYPAASKIELFARRRRPGWDAWGNEVGGCSNRKAA